MGCTEIWLANLTALAWVLTERVNVATSIGVGFFLIDEIFSQHVAPRQLQGSWSDGEGPKVGGGVLNAMQNNLILVFDFTLCIGKMNLTACFA